MALNPTGKKSLKQSIFVFIYSFVFIICAIFFIPSYIQQQGFVKQEILERGKSLSRNLALNCQKALEQRDMNSLFMLTDSLMRETDILWVIVIDPHGQVIAQNGTIDFEYLVPRLKKNQASEKIAVDTIRMPDGKTIYNNYIGVRQTVVDNTSMVNKELSLLEGFGSPETAAPVSTGDNKAASFIGVVHVGVSMQRLHAVQQQLGTQMFILFLLALGVSTVIGIYFARFLVNPINQFISMMKDIASRRGDLTQRMKLDRNDEYGEMAEYFNTFIQNIAKIVKDTVQLVGTMNVSLEEISSTSEELSANADSVNATVQTVTNDLEKQEKESTTTHNLIEQVLTTILQITSKSQDAFRVSAETEKVSRDSVKVMQDSVKMINGISGQMSVIEERMQRLKKSLGGIGSFVETIKKIASQTNLLSLNAAIEAARAGEAGRGFSVVAEEVRKLAEDSASASEQIQNLIEKIEGEVQGTSDATRQGTQVVGQGAKMIEQAGTSFSTIMKSAEHSSGVVEDISKSLQQQSNSLKATIQQVENVKQLVKNNFIATQSVAASVEEQTASFEQISTAIQKLSEDAQNIRKLVVEFKIN